MHCCEQQPPGSEIVDDDRVAVAKIDRVSGNAEIGRSEIGDLDVIAREQVLDMIAIETGGSVTKYVRSRAAIQDIITCAAREDVIPRSAVDRVIAGATP